MSVFGNSFKDDMYDWIETIKERDCLSSFDVIKNLNEIINYYIEYVIPTEIEK